MIRENYIENYLERGKRENQCPTCKGTGKVDGEKCSTCGGTGKLD